MKNLLFALVASFAILCSGCADQAEIDSVAEKVNSGAAACSCPGCASAKALRLNLKVLVAANPQRVKLLRASAPRAASVVAKASVHVQQQLRASAPKAASVNAKASVHVWRPQHLPWSRAPSAKASVLAKQKAQRLQCLHWKRLLLLN